MLTDKALYERYWGRFPVLGRLLGDKKIPDHHYGFSSLSDNNFSYIQRQMEISILIIEHGDLIKGSMAKFDGPDRERLGRELIGFSEELAHIAEGFKQSAAEIRNRYLG